MSVNQEIDCYSFSHCEEDCVWPGDLNGNGRVEADDLVYMASMLGDDTPNAQSRSRITNEWFGFESESWQDAEAGIDYKYGDVNGNSELNSYDLSLLVNNLKLQNSVYEKQADVFADLDQEGIGITLDSDEISAIGDILDASASGNINLGDELSNFSKPIVAISFDILIDTNLVFFSPFFNEDGVTVIFDDKKNYYEDENDPHAQDNPDVKMSNRVSYVMYNLNEPITQGGILNNRIGITAHTFGKTGNENGQEYTKIEIANVLALDADGNKIDVGVRYSDSVLVTDLIYDLTLNVEDDNENIQVSVFPNPVNDKLFVRLNKAEKGIIKVTNLEGKLIHSQTYNTQDLEIDTRGWNKGAYIINFSSNNKSETKKIIKL